MRVNAFNGADVTANPGTPANWYGLNIYNNMIVNNVAAYGGGGIALQDVAKSEIINNTIANNNSTSTAAAAFPGGQITTSAAEGAGIVSGAHSTGLATDSGQTFSNPTLTNNIIWQNKSYTWDGTLTSTEKLVPYAGPDGTFWDLQVFGTPAPQLLDPQNCLLSSLAAGYGVSNTTAAPNFAGAYTNNLQSAIVIDEGGNSISVRYTPLTRTSDYHINTGVAGDPSVLLSRPSLNFDYDNLARPNANGIVEIGADDL
jgi:parallel beta-helix repeat protein